MSSSQHHPHLPIASEIMKTSLLTLQRDTPILEAVRLLLKHEVSGAPVVDAEGRLLGVCSDLECLRVLTAGEFYEDDYREEGDVGASMRTGVRCAAPHDDIYSLAQLFLTQEMRRLPVVEDGVLIGQVSHHDVLRALEVLRQQREPHTHYPDYREPAADVGAKRSH